MPRGKIQMSLIGHARGRAKAFARRKAGLVKKAQQLAELCDVDVALVCAGPDDGAAPPVVWESDPGAVIDRYLRLPPDKRAKHTHLGYIDGQLGKEKGRLARKQRQGLDAFACPGEATLRDTNLEELLASIDAALLATAERQKALGVAADDGGPQLGQVSSDAVVGQGGPLFVGGGDDIEAWVNELTWDGVEPLPFNNASMMQQPASGVIEYINGNGVGMGGNHQCQVQQMPPPPGNGENGHGQLPWHAYQPNTAISFLDYGYQCTDTDDNNYVAMDEYSSQMPVPSNANGAYDGWYDQVSWGADESSSRDAVLPAAACPSLDIAGNPGYMPVPPQQEHPSMSTGSFMVMDAGGHAYQTGCLADYLQCPDASQLFGSEPEPLHYLSDMAQGILHYNDDLEAGGCSSGGAQILAQSHSCSGTGTQQYQDPGVQRFWVMEGPPGSTDVAAAAASARGRVGGRWAGGHYQPCISVYQ